MNTALIDGKLDRSLHLKMTHKGGIFDLLKLHPERMESYFMKDVNSAKLQIYIPTAEIENGHIRAIKNRKDLIDSGQFSSIMENMKNYENFKVVIDILNVPSVIIVDSYLMGNQTHFIFKYHSNFGREISEILCRCLEECEDFSIESMTRPGGFRQEIMHINEFVPLFAFQTSSVIPEEMGPLFEVARKYPGTVTEVEPRSITIYGVRAISYGTGPMDVDGLSIISKDSFIYETRQLDSVMMKRRQELNRHRIPRISTVLELRGNRIFNTTIIPESSARLQLSIYLKTEFQLRQFDPKIEIYSRVDEKIWGHL